MWKTPATGAEAPGFRYHSISVASHVQEQQAGRLNLLIASAYVPVVGSYSIGSAERFESSDVDASGASDQWGASKLTNPLDLAPTTLATQVEALDLPTRFGAHAHIVPMPTHIALSTYFPHGGPCNR